MAYHIHNCELHDNCAVLVNLNNKFKSHYHITNLLLCQKPEDDDCMEKKTE